MYNIRADLLSLYAYASSLSLEYAGELMRHCAYSSYSTVSSGHIYGVLFKSQMERIYAQLGRAQVTNI